MKKIYSVLAATMFSSVCLANDVVEGFKKPIAYMRQDCEVKGKSGKSYTIGTTSKDICSNNVGGRYIELSHSKVASGAKSGKADTSH